MQPSSVYLDGLGSLTLGNIQGGFVNTQIDVTARNSLTVAAGDTVDSGTSTLSLAADVNYDGTGDSNTGLLSILAGATVTSGNATANAITLRGYNISIDTSSNPAVVGATRALSTTASATLSGLNQPYALAFDGSGNFYVSNLGTNTVSKFAAAGTLTATLTGLTIPLGLGIRRQRQPLRGQHGSTTVSEFAPGSTTPTATLGGLASPCALAFDGSGNLFVLNFGNNTISEFAPGAPRLPPPLPGLALRAMTFDSSGNLYVVNKVRTAP